MKKFEFPPQPGQELTPEMQAAVESGDQDAFMSLAEENRSLVQNDEGTVSDTQVTPGEATSAPERDANMMNSASFDNEPKSPGFLSRVGSGLRNFGKESVKKASFYNAWGKAGSLRSAMRNKEGFSLVNDLMEMGQSIQSEDVKSEAYKSSTALMAQKMEKLISIKDKMSPKQLENFEAVMLAHKQNTEETRKEVNEALSFEKKAAYLQAAKDNISSLNIWATVALATTGAAPVAWATSANLGTKGLLDTLVRKNNLERGGKETGYVSTIASAVSENVRGLVTLKGKAWGDLAGYALPAILIGDHFGNDGQLREGLQNALKEKLGSGFEKLQTMISGTEAEEVLVNTAAPEVAAGVNKLDIDASFEQGGVPPIDGSLAGSPEWQGQAPSGFEAQEVPVKATSMEIGQEGTYSEHTSGKIDGGIEAMQEFRAQLRAEYPDTPRPDVVEKILSYDNPVDAAKAFGFFNPEADVPNMNGAESFVLQPGDTFNINESGEFVFTHDGENHTLLSDAGERGDTAVGEVKKVGMIESLKDQFKNYTNMEEYKVAVCPPGEELPFGVDGQKVYYTEDGRLLAYAEYADDQAYWGVKAGDLSFYDANGIQPQEVNDSVISTPVYGESLEGQEYLNPTSEHIKNGYAFERDGRYYYYNHDNYLNGNPYGENLPIQNQAPVGMVYEQTPQTNLDPEATQVLPTQEITGIDTTQASEQSLLERFNVPRRLDAAAAYIDSTFLGDLKDFDITKLPTVLQNAVISDNVPLNGKTIDVMRFANDAESGINVIPFFNEEEGIFQTFVQSTRMDSSGNVQSEIINTYSGSPKETLYQALERVYQIKK